MVLLSVPKDAILYGHLPFLPRQCVHPRSGIESVRRISISVHGEMMKRAPILLACLVGIAVFPVVACGPAADRGSSGDPASRQRTESEHDPLPAAQREQSEQYFQRVLSESGTDLETRVGEYLNVLDLDAKQLQAMPVDQAYKVAHDAAARFTDERIRRQMLLSLFDEREGR